MDESAFLAAAAATLDRIGLSLDAALETSNARFAWQLTDGVLLIELAGDARIVVRRDVARRAIVVEAGGAAVDFVPHEGRWRDARGEALRDALVRLLKAQARVSVRMPELPAP